MSARILFLLLLLCGSMISTAQADPEQKKPSTDEQPTKPHVITEADHNQTVQVAVGTLIEVRLIGDLPKTGWESNSVSGSLERLVAKQAEQNASPNPEFTLAKNAIDQAIGTYVFRYLAKSKGLSQLRLVYVYPGGPKPMRRSATKLVREFKVNVEVIESETKR